mmetsp:Transcript_5505/g.15335  ORF Transcript_5505/g.15335 Transcript_5505/m.15335 type:complete len:1697 (+) Transcript_5505:302-5392(+)
MADRGGSGRRKWSQQQAAVPDMNLRQLADSQSMEFGDSHQHHHSRHHLGRHDASIMSSIESSANTIGDPESDRSHSYTRSTEDSSIVHQVATIDSLHDHVWRPDSQGGPGSSQQASRHNLTQPEIRLLRDSIMEMDLDLHSMAHGLSSGPSTIVEGSDSDDDYSMVDDEFIEDIASDDEESPKYNKTNSGELRVMASEAPSRQRRVLPSSRPISGFKQSDRAVLGPSAAASSSAAAAATVSSRGARPISGDPVRRKLPAERDSQEDLDGVLAALSKENQALAKPSSRLKAPATNKTLAPIPSSESPQKKKPMAATSAAKPRGLAPLKTAAGSATSKLDTSTVSKESSSPETPTSIAIKKITSRLARLDPSKQRVLQQVLDKLEKADAAGAIDVSAMFSSLRPGGGGSRLSVGSGPAGISPPGKLAVPLPSTREEDPAGWAQEVVLRILSTHGGGVEVGLTEVELFDAKGFRITVPPDGVILRGEEAGDGGGGTAASVGRIVSGRSRTTNELHMWQSRLPRPSSLAPGLEVVLRTAAGSEPAAQLLVWNFNSRNMQDLKKGVREMQVYVSGDLTWQGVISRGCGNQSFDYSTRIALSEAAAAKGIRQDTADSSKAKAVGELSNEELLEELKRRSLPITPEQQTPLTGPQQAQQQEEQQQQQRAVEAPLKQEQPRARQQQPKATQAKQQSAAAASKEAVSSVKAAESTPDGSPAKPGNKSKLEGLRNRLSARRGGHGGSRSGGVSSSDRKEEVAVTSGTAAHGDGGPIWLSDSRPGSTGRTGSDSGTGPRSGRRRDSDNGREPQPYSVPVATPASSSSGGAALGPLPLDGSRPRPTSGRRRAVPEAAPNHNPDEEPAVKGKGDSGRARKAVPAVDASLDSLAFFQKTQAGRLDQTLSKQAKLKPSAEPVNLEDTIDDVDALIQAELAGLGGTFDDADVLIREELAQLTSAPMEGRREAGGGGGEGFAIPERPSGRTLELSIFTTWGDPHYVGLCGIELFDSSGRPVGVSQPKKQVSAVPESINELSEYSADPRTPDKLLDGVYMTCDDLHVWLAPFERGTPNLITVRLNAVTELGMLRIWNYNKSRIHSQRGARMIKATLDGRAIFEGEVSRAPGSLVEAPGSAECILFTESEAALAAIDKHDEKYLRAQASALQAGHEGSSSPPRQIPASDLEVVTNDVDDPLGVGAAKVGSDGRPITSAVHVPAPRPARASTLGSVMEEPAEAPSERQGMAPGVCPGLKGRELKVVVLATWGDPYYMGLTGLEVLGAGGRPMQITPSSLDACPRDLNAIPGYSGDDRTLDKLLDGTNATTNDAHMWLAPMKMSTLSGGPVSADDPNGWLSITLGSSPAEVTGLRIWNYNKSLEDTGRGLKAVQLFLDGKPLSPPGGHLLAKAPGRGDLDFGQYLPLHPGMLEAVGRDAYDAPQPSAYPSGMEASAWLSSMPDPEAASRVWKAARQARNHSGLVRQDFDTPLLPCGFVMKIYLLSSWGDAHFVGLTGIQLVDAVQGPIQISADRVSASPRSVADLPGMAHDVRLPARLVDSPNTGSPSHSWLAPVAGSSPDIPVATAAGGGPEALVNCLSICLDRPIMLAGLRLWNYAKNPLRGAQEIEVMLDDLMIYKGFVRPAPASLQGPWQHTILFHNDPQLIQQERAAVYSHLATLEREAPIVLVNERKFMSGSASGTGYSEPGDRPSTSVVA